MRRAKGGKIVPVLQNKLDQLSTANGHATAGLSSDKDVEGASDQTLGSTSPATRTPGPGAPRIVIIGAGSRGSAYARAITTAGEGHVIAVCEPASVPRREFGDKYVWGPKNRDAKPHEQFPSWPEYITYEQDRRQKVSSKELVDGDDEFQGADAAFVCVLDHQHILAVRDLAPLGLHIMCEKPLATSLQDCIGIYGSITREWETLARKTIFSICHVLRYSPHNMLLHRLVQEQAIIGHIVAVEHTEPVGWWHFTHSYVRSVFS